VAARARCMRILSAPIVGPRPAYPGCEPARNRWLMPVSSASTFPFDAAVAPRQDESGPRVSVSKPCTWSRGKLHCCVQLRARPGGDANKENRSVSPPMGHGDAQQTLALDTRRQSPLELQR